MFKRVLLLGPYKSNTGPANVNKSFIENRDTKISYIHTTGRLESLERLKLIFFTTIIISGGIRGYELKICKLLHKKLIYIMHGCVKFESDINRLNLPQTCIDIEEEILRESDVIVCVSKKYSDWVKKYFPQHIDKITYINNGLFLNVRPFIGKERFSIALSGGNRLQKKNGAVCQAVQKLSEQGYVCNVYVFGGDYPNNDDIYSYSFVKKMGQLRKEEYYEILDKIELFILNSIVDSFGLVVGDALNCNCSLLMSNGVGATSIMNTSKQDIIYDCDNITEISEKIKFLFEHPNSKRLYESIDKENVSEKNAYLKLKGIINQI